MEAAGIIGYSMRVQTDARIEFCFAVVEQEQGAWAWRVESRAKGTNGDESGGVGSMAI